MTAIIPILSEKSAPMTDPRALMPIEVALDTLRRAGFSEDETVAAYRAIVGFVMGSAMLEVGGFMSPDHDRWQNMEESLAEIPVERFPRLLQMLPAWHDCVPDDVFDHGLDLLLTGLRARVEPLSA